MPLITRISRLFQADIHAVLDRIEEPGALLRQAVRDMETALAADQRQLVELTRSQDALATRERDLSNAVEQLPGELDACFIAGQEDLARSLIRRRLECERLAAILNRRRANLADRHEVVHARVEQNRARLEGMRQKAELLSDTDQDASRDTAWPVEAETGPTVSDADVEVAFLREKQRRVDSGKDRASTKGAPSPGRVDSGKDRASTKGAPSPGRVDSGKDRASTKGAPSPGRVDSGKDRASTKEAPSPGRADS